MAITKVINSESQAYRPVLTDTLVLDAVPTVNSFNSVTSDAVARAVAGASGEVPQVTENDNGKVLKAIYDAGGPAVEWGEVESGATYTAGDGIDIDAQNAVSVKAGNGLEIGDVTSSGETVSLTTSEYYRESYSTGYDAYDICPLTDSLLESINSGLTLKLNYGAYLGYLPDVTAYACLYSYASTTEYEVTLDKRLVLGSDVLNQGGLPPNSEVTFNGSSVNAELSNTTMSDLIADMSSNTYHVGILVKTNDSYFALNFQVSNSSTRPSGPTTMATYTETTTIHDALNVSNPLPTSAVGDAGKVLTVDAAGAAAWTTPSGGGTSFTVTSVTTGPWSIINNPDLNLITLNSSVMFGHSNPILLNIDIAFPNTNKIDLTSFSTDPVGASLMYTDDGSNEVCLPIQAYKEWYGSSYRLRAVGTIVFPPCQYNASMKLSLPSTVTLTKGDSIASGVVETYRILN